MSVMDTSKPNTATFDFSNACIQKIALTNSEERASELAKDLNGHVWKVNEILNGIDEKNPIYLIIAKRKG